MTLDLADYPAKTREAIKAFWGNREVARRKQRETACVLLSPRTAVDSGDYSELSEMTGLKTFIATLAGHMAAEAARSQPGL